MQRLVEYLARIVREKHQGVRTGNLGLRGKGRQRLVEGPSGRQRWSFLKDPAFPMSPGRGVRLVRSSSVVVGFGHGKHIAT